MKRRLLRPLFWLLPLAVLCAQSTWPAGRAEAADFLDCKTQAVPPFLREDPLPGGGVVQTVEAYGFVRCAETHPRNVEVTLQRHRWGPSGGTSARSSDRRIGITLRYCSTKRWRGSAWKASTATGR